MFKKLAVFVLFLSVLLTALTLSPKVFASVNPYVYPVSGYVFDDRNGNGYQDFGEMGIAGKTVYADNTGSGYSTTTNQYGYFQLNVPNGTHSVEIAGAGAGGSMPTTAQKIPVSGPSGSLRYGIQQGGYSVDGRVLDEYGNPVRGATVYVDRPSSGNTVTTDQNGYYRINNVGYDESTPVYGVSGGHNVYVLGYDGNPVLVNPQTPVITERRDMTVSTGQQNPYPPVCTPTYGYARNPSTGQCQYFNNTCIPAGWQVVPNCNVQNPPSGQPVPGQCVPNTQAGQPYQGCSGNQQWCTLTPTYGTNCQVQNVATNCQSIPGYCGNQTYGTSSAGETSSLQNFGDYNTDYNNWVQTVAQPAYEQPVFQQSVVQTPSVTDFWSGGDMWANNWYQEQQPVFQDVNYYDQGWVDYGQDSYYYGY